MIIDFDSCNLQNFKKLHIKYRNNTKIEQIIKKKKKRRRVLPYHKVSAAQPLQKVTIYPDVY